MPQDPLVLAKKAARLGWHIFPVKKNCQYPPLLEGWQHRATDDIGQVMVWAEEHPRCNWGVACGPSELFVVDVDAKKGKRGLENIDLLVRKYGDIKDTFMVATPTGGIHFYFKGPGPTTQNKLAKDIDTRGEGGYVVLPGGVREEGDYAIICSSRPKPPPKWIGKEMDHKVHKKEDTTAPAIELDQLANIQRALQFLKHDAKPAIQGDAGDLTTFQTACRVKDYGLSPRITLDLMAEHYNERCSPPWEFDELKDKVRGAYAYGTKAVGGGSAQAVFAGVKLPSHIRPFSLSAASINPNNIPRRRWVMDGRYIRGYMTVTVAPGGVGKTTLLFLEAISIITGQELSGRKIIDRGNVWIIGEDPQDETERRIAAMADLHNVPLSQLSGLHYSSFRDGALVYASKGPVSSGVVLNGPLIRKTIQFIRDNKIALWVIDPFIAIHDVEENDNSAVNKVVQALHRIAEETGCAISIIHHTRKKGDKGGIGDMDTARGASSLLSAARVSHTLTPMSEDDAQELGVAPEDSPLFVRMDKAKANLSPPNETTEWLRLVPVSLPCGDSVGAIERKVFDVMQIKEQNTHELFDVIISTVGIGDQMGVNKLAVALQKDPTVPPSIRELSRTALGRRIENVLKMPVDHGSCTIKYVVGEVPGHKGNKWVVVEPNSLLC